ncbi:TIGR03620 family F420-dependent LLM class oxidoreductase [Yinghuangia seranimata]|uniref:TIGR03620 family F420-dependent LLM class oxidoreductase n=1 Tax=Yinghuangia seranimata TaxID=408067 RepID=UPI00248B3731|nr:TIGR03620 family F420-dependent LLM class oxidoreductase [Yinghuangia seranimata]MDI2125853.1 TIGR03620 family F420-dependent LLM class oxidoreductase [Yinghuangia seranimata]
MDQPRPRLGRVGVWAGELDSRPVAELRAAASLVEELGYGALWFPETTGREAVAQAAILLAATRGITVAAGMTDIYARDAVTAAAAQRTLDEAYPGRFLLGLWESHPSLVDGVRGHGYEPPVHAMSGYLDALDAAPFGPASQPSSPHRVLNALDPAMLALAAERAWGATVLGMPVEHTRAARAILGPDALLAVTQICVLGRDRTETADAARGAAASALPNRRALLKDLGHDDPDALGDRLVDALVAHGPAARVAERVHAHLEAGADHVSLHVMGATGQAWRLLAGTLW